MGKWGEAPEGSVIGSSVPLAECTSPKNLSVMCAANNAVSGGFDLGGCGGGSPPCPPKGGKSFRQGL